MYSRTINLLKRVLSLLSEKRKKSLYKIIPLAIITGLTDVLVVAMVSRLFVIFIQKENSPSIPFSNLITNDPLTKLILIICLYVLLNWLASFLRLSLRAFQERLRARVFIDLSEIAQRNIFNQKYDFFLSEKSENLSSKVAEKFVRPILQIVSGFFIVSFIFIAILSFAKITAFYLIICLVIGYTFISFSVSPLIRDSVKQRIILEKEINTVLKESIRTIIDVHLTGSEKFFQERYLKAGKQAFPYLWKAETFPEFPRSLVEPFGITLIFSIGLFPFISNQNTNNVIEIVPFLATIAVASLKLTPPLQDLFRGIIDLKGGIPDLEEALKILELKQERIYPINREGGDLIIPKKSIELRSLSFKYPLMKNYSLQNININITIGSKIAFVGKTGSGKTTTANQILGLLRPTSGGLFIDNKEIKNNNLPYWQSLCSYVPQSINLLNGDIVSNVAYGLNKEDINESKVWESLVAAQLEDLIDHLPNGIKTMVGDNGIRLSGGQRQRIAIARAFYRDSRLLILDEATSALDNTTESKVLKALSLINKKLTILFIAHRLSTVRECDCIYEFEKGRIKSEGTYENLIINSESFKKMIRTNKNQKKLF